MTDEAPPETANVPATLAGQAERFVAGILNTANLDRLAKSMPSHVEPERFKRNLVNAVVAHPSLLECKAADVYHEVGRAGALGFHIDPVLGEAYLITGYDKRRGGKIPQLRIGYRGFQKLSRQSGFLKGSAFAHEVCELDEFKVTMGTNKAIHHALPEDAWERGNVKGYYAIIQYTDGTYDFEVMGHKAVERIRDRSDGYKAFKDGKISSNPWDSDYDEMAKKTVLRRLLKRAPLSPEVGDAMRIDDEEYGAFLDGNETKLLTPAQKLKERRSGKVLTAPENESGFSREHVEAEIKEPPGPVDAAQAVVDAVVEVEAIAEAAEQPVEAEAEPDATLEPEAVETVVEEENPQAVLNARRSAEISAADTPPQPWPDSPKEHAPEGLADTPLDVIGGPAPRDVTYFLSADEIGADDKVQLYKNGEPFSRVSQEGLAKHPTYDTHPDPEPAPEQAGGGVLAKMAAMTSWLTVKAELGAVYKDDGFKSADAKTQREFRCAVYRIGETLISKGDPVSIKTDVGFFRLWLDTLEDAGQAEDAEKIFAEIVKTPAHQKMSPDQQTALADVVGDTIKRVKG